MGDWRQKTSGRRPIVCALDEDRARLTDYRGASETFALSDIDGATRFVLARPAADVVYEHWSPSMESYINRFTAALRQQMNPYGLNEREEQRAVYFAMKPRGYDADNALPYMQKVVTKLVARGVLVKDGAVYRTARPLMYRHEHVRVIGPNQHPDADDLLLDMPRPHVPEPETATIDRLVEVDGRYVSYEGVCVIVEALQHAVNAGLLGDDRASTARKIIKALTPRVRSTG